MIHSSDDLDDEAKCFSSSFFVGGGGGGGGVGGGLGGICKKKTLRSKPFLCFALLLTVQTCRNTAAHRSSSLETF